MRGRRGFALLAVLWLVAALGVVAAVGLAAGRTGALATRNRILLSRATWAREACLGILMARFAEDSTAEAAGAQLRVLPRVDLGRGTWCEVEIEDPGAKLNLNRADSTMLVQLLDSPELAAELLHWREQYGLFADVAELRSLPGFDSSLADRLGRLATTRGSGAVNVNEASEEVLGLIPGIPSEAVDIVLRRRSFGRPVTSLDELLALASPATRQALLQDYTGWLGRLRFTPAQLLARVTGGVDRTPITSTELLTLAPVPHRLAVVRREAE